VTEWRKQLVLPEDAGKVNLDAWGVKRLFSHALRRWLTGSTAPRESYHESSLNSVWCIFTAAWGTPSADENGDALRAANDDNPPLAIMDGAADEEAVEAHEEAVEADVYEVQDGDSSITTTELEDTPPPKSSLEHEDGCGTVLQGGGTRGDTVTGETPDPQAKPVDVEFIEDSQATVYEYPDVEDSQDPFDSSLIQGS
ncbi:unnamed protein product, partial [Durusdinium trenchii]